MLKVLKKFDVLKKFSGLSKFLSLSHAERKSIMEKYLGKVSWVVSWIKEQTVLDKRTDVIL